MVVGDAISRGINLLVAMLEITLNSAPKIVPAVTITTLADSLVAKPPRSLRPRLPPTVVGAQSPELVIAHYRPPRKRPTGRLSAAYRRVDGTYWQAGRSGRRF